MTNVEVQGELPPSIPKEQILVMAKQICQNEAPDSNFEISIQLVDSTVMREYNRIYRGVNRSTDVLSFVGDEIDLGGFRTRLCDIIIDTNQVFEQKGSKTLSEELWLILIHGLLHLMGYDHIRTADKKKMEDAEDNYRKQIPGGGIA